MKGLFITFEGPDGSGKSTQIKRLAHFLDTEGISYVFTREPGGTAISDEIRALLLDPAHQEMENETEVLLYAASRAQHVREKISPALKEVDVVLCDRFVDASFAYQGYGLGVDVEKINDMNRFATGGLTPDRSYLIDVSPETGRKRMLARQQQPSTAAKQLDRIEQKQLNYHKAVRNGFQTLYNKNQTRICYLDGEQDIDSIFAEIKADFQRLWQQHHQPK